MKSNVLSRVRFNILSSNVYDMETSLPHGALSEFDKHK